MEKEHADGAGERKEVDQDGRREEGNGAVLLLQVPMYKGSIGCSLREKKWGDG